MRPPQRKLSDLFKFSKPRTPGYEISRDFYLSVLASTTQLPTPRQVMCPKGGYGTIPGMMAPLAGSQRHDLERPIVRGVYALSSVDQKTVLKLMVMPRDEAGFEPEPFLRSEVGLAAADEVRHRIAATWHVMQLTFEAFDPKIFPSLDFFLLSARRLAELTDGVVADPICQRYQLPAQVIQDPRSHSDFDVREHLNIVEGASSHTRGLIKFALPELVIQSSSPIATKVLMDVADGIFQGKPLSVGQRHGDFAVSSGNFTHGSWEGIPSFELVPVPSLTLTQALESWSLGAG